MSNQIVILIYQFLYILFNILPYLNVFLYSQS